MAERGGGGVAAKGVAGAWQQGRRCGVHPRGVRERVTRRRIDPPPYGEDFPTPVLSAAANCTSVSKAFVSK
jgi:hypothetical protein